MTYPVTFTLLKLVSEYNELSKACTLTDKKQDAAALAKWGEIAAEANRLAGVVLTVERGSMTPTPPAPAIDIERMLAECIPGGTICDPQAVADSVRAWFAVTPPAPVAPILTDAELVAIFDRYGGDMVNCARSIERNVCARLAAPVHHVGAVGPDPDEGMAAILRSLVAWEDKYPASRVFSYSAIQAVTAELSEIVKQARAALAPVGAVGTLPAPGEMPEQDSGHSVDAPVQPSGAANPASPFGGPHYAWRTKLFELHAVSLEAFALYWDDATNSLTTIRKKNEAEDAFVRHVYAYPAALPEAPKEQAK